MANLHISDELDAELERAAGQLGCTKDELAEDAIRRKFEDWRRRASQLAAASNLEPQQPRTLGPCFHNLYPRGPIAPPPKSCDT